MIDLEPGTAGDESTTGPSRARYVLALDASESFAVFGPGWKLMERTRRIDRASHFDSMSEATMSAILAGLDDFTIQLHQQT